MGEGTSRVKRILVINTPGLRNRGGMAVVTGAAKCLKQTMPEAQITVVCHHYARDGEELKRIFENQRVEVVKHPWYREHSSVALTFLHSGISALFHLIYCVLGRVSGQIGLPFQTVYQRQDVILDLNTDSLNELYGRSILAFALFNILAALVAGKPIVIGAASIGVFEKTWTRFWAKLLLNRVALIMVREEVSKEYLATLSVNKPRVYLTADHAFLLEAAAPERTKEILVREGIDESELPMVGVAVSQLISRFAFPDIKDPETKYQIYITTMANVVDYIAQALGASIVLIPHGMDPSEDDRIISRSIYEKTGGSHKVHLITGEYMAHELKGIIGRCDMFIGCRMHATIASTSMSVPTVAVVYGHKSHGLIGDMMAQEAYIIDIEKYNSDQLSDQLKARIDDAWANRDAIRSELRKRSEKAKEQALLNGRLINDLLERKQR